MCDNKENDTDWLKSFRAVNYYSSYSVSLQCGVNTCSPDLRMYILYGDNFWNSLSLFAGHFGSCFKRHEQYSCSLYKKRASSFIRQIFIPSRKTGAAWHLGVRPLFRRIWCASGTRREPVQQVSAPRPTCSDKLTCSDQFCSVWLRGGRGVWSVMTLPHFSRWMLLTCSYFILFCTRDAPPPISAAAEASCAVSLVLGVGADTKDSCFHLPCKEPGWSHQHWMHICVLLAVSCCSAHPQPCYEHSLQNSYTEAVGLGQALLKARLMVPAMQETTPGAMSSTVCLFQVYMLRGYMSWDMWIQETRVKIFVPGSRKLDSAVCVSVYIYTHTDVCILFFKDRIHCSSLCRHRYSLCTSENQTNWKHGLKRPLAGTAIVLHAALI